MTYKNAPSKVDVCPPRGGGAAPETEGNAHVSDPVVCSTSRVSARGAFGALEIRRWVGGYYLKKRWRVEREIAGRERTGGTGGPHI